MSKIVSRKYCPRWSQLNRAGDMGVTGTGMGERTDCGNDEPQKHMHMKSMKHEESRHTHCYGHRTSPETTGQRIMVLILTSGKYTLERRASLKWDSTKKRGPNGLLIRLVTGTHPCMNWSFKLSSGAFSLLRKGIAWFFSLLCCFS